MLSLGELKKVVQQTLLSVNARNALTKIVDGLCHYNAGSFLAARTTTDANVTGDGTVYSVPFPNVLYDHSNGFAPSTGVFTATTAGVYSLEAKLFLTGIDVAHTIGELSLAGPETHTITFNPASAMTSSNEVTIGINQQMELGVGDSVSVQIVVSGGTKVVDVYGASGAVKTSFAGHLMP